MRRFIPADTWVVVLPGLTATQYSGGGPPGSGPVQGCPLVRRYSGEHPIAISSSRFARVGWQSIAWFWLPPLAPTRSTVAVSVGLESSSVPPIPTRTTKSSVQDGCALEQRWTSSTPDELDASPICKSRTEPERDGVAANVRCRTSANVSLHGLLFLFVQVPLPVT